MTKRISAKHKISRRLGENLWGNPRSSFNRREYAPGEHGQSRRARKPSDFALQLRAKQKLKSYYGNMTEKQFRRMYAEASNRRGDTGENLVGLLEQRLDMVLFRAKFAPSVFAARQLINHGHVQVNGGRVKTASYRVRVDDEVAVAERAQQMQPVMQARALSWRDVPSYLAVDDDKISARLSRIPKLEEIPYVARMEPNLVVEYYSR